MASLLQNLLRDMERRGSCVVTVLSNLGINLPKAFHQHHAATLNRVNRVVGALKQMIVDPDLTNPLLEPNFFQVFKRLSEAILNIEDTSLLILNRCSPDDHYLTSLLAQICKEVGYSDPPPLCGALSFQYFQALLGNDIIMAPQTQAYELLSLPDLYHELAHFVFRQQKAFEISLLTLIHQYFATALRKGRQNNLPQASLDALREFFNLWAGDWKIEFACDMIATYWCGPAYGWANLRLSATRGDPFQDSFTHPADEARKVGIECMLNLLGHKAAAKELDDSWNDLKRLSPSVQPGDYMKRYPQRLLEQLAQAIFDSCIVARFTTADRQLADGRAPVCRAVADAWSEFRKNAVEYAVYESAALLSLKAQVIQP